MNKDIMKHLETLTPKKILDLLNTFIIGQENAKKAMAVALRNRYRRMLLKQEIKEEVYPKNILLIGSTGVGKTEIARRLAKIIKAPFIKTEATRFTEVGYVGRDVESMVRDLVAKSFYLVKKEYESQYHNIILEQVDKVLLNYLLLEAQERSQTDFNEAEEIHTLEAQLKNKELEEKEITITLSQASAFTKNGMFGVLSNIGSEEIEDQMNHLFENILSGQKKDKKLKIKDARSLLFEEEFNKLIDIDKIKLEAVERAEHLGIIFIDEIDKIASSAAPTSAEVSRDGVQRDLLPIVEGTTVNTKYGSIQTDYILFIGAGAFHVSKPSDLIPELQGRFPVRVQLHSLKKKELKQILTEPKHSLIEQYTLLLKTEKVTIVVLDETIDFIADYCAKVNSQLEDIGARRLYTVLEKIFEELLFNASEMKNQTIHITAQYAENALKEISTKTDLSKYIL